jgi:hypothetical protein
VLTIVPATKFNASIAWSKYSGPAHVHLFDGAPGVSAKRMREEILPEIFTPEVQIEAVRAMDLAALMRWDAATLVAPGEPGPATAPCSAELDIRLIGYMQTAFGKKMRILYELKDASRPGGAPIRVSGEVRQGMPLSENYGPAEDLTAARAGLTILFQRAVAEIVEEKLRGLPSRD